MKVQDILLPYHLSERHSTWFNVEAFWFLFLRCRFRSSLVMLIILRICTIFLSHSWRMQMHVIHTTAPFLVLNSFIEGIILWHSTLINCCSLYRNVRVKFDLFWVYFHHSNSVWQIVRIIKHLLCCFLTPFSQYFVLGTYTLRSTNFRTNFFKITELERSIGQPTN